MNLQQTAHQQRIRRRRIIATAAAGLCVLAVGALTLDIATVSGVAPGTRIAGISLDTDTSRARAAVEARGRQLAARMVTLTLNGRTVDHFTPSAFGSRVLTDEALVNAEANRPGPFGRIVQRLTGSEPVAVKLPVSYRGDALDNYVADVAARLDRSPRDATLVARGDTVAVRAAIEGLSVQQEDLRRLLSEDLSSVPDTLEVPALRERPVTSTEIARGALVQALSFLEQPATIRIGGLVRALPRPVLARAVRIEGSAASLSSTALERPLRRAFSGLQRGPRDASFVTDGQHARIVPSRAGLSVDAARVAAGLMTSARPVIGRLRRTEPSFTTRRARALQISERVGGYSTSFNPGQDRVINVGLGAKVLDGHIIPAGGTLSLNEVLGKRTEERGFVPAPMIVGTIEIPAVGGGVSQIATTLYNAALESGLDVVRHTPHRLYISRYPAGRDATISWTEPDLVIRNDWAVPVLIRAETGVSWIKINMYSRPLGRRVELATSEPFAQTDPPTRKIINDALVTGEERDIQPGGKGFSITVTRRVYRRETLIKDERFSTTYAPDPHLIAVPPGTPDAIALPKAPGGN